MHHKIPYQQLSAEALQGVIDGYVLQEGTDYGDQTYSLDQKRDAALGQLRNGTAQIWFDAETETVSIQPADEQ